MFLLFRGPILAVILVLSTNENQSRRGSPAFGIVIESRRWK
jgi:hypothetical protein